MIVDISYAGMPPPQAFDIGVEKKSESLDKRAIENSGKGDFTKETKRDDTKNCG